MYIYNFIQRICDAWLQETIRILKDKGAILFCVILPLAYPVIYSWIYNNEVVREVPIAIVDNSHSTMSREFTQKMDASPDVSVALYCSSINEAKDAVGHGQIYGFLYFPEDFAIKSGRLEQTHVSVYCDMSYMLTYKAIFQTATAVSMMMGSKIQAKLQGHYTSREAEISARPLDYEEVPIFNTTGGYGNFIIPCVLVLIIQQAMMLAVGLVSGSDREKGFPSLRGNYVVSKLIGKTVAYMLIFGLMFTYVTLVVPHLFGFVSLVHGKDLLLLALPYLLACTFFAQTLIDLVRYRENVILLVVFTSIPFLFLSGMSWPESNVPGFWQGVSDLIPSTFAIRGFVRMSSMGARIGDIAPEIRALWIHVIVYGILACLVIYRRYEVREAGYKKELREKENDL